MKAYHINDKLSLILTSFTFDVSIGDIIFYNGDSITKIIYHYKFNGKIDIGVLDITRYKKYRCMYKNDIIVDVNYLLNKNILKDITTQYERDKKLEKLL